MKIVVSQISQGIGHQILDAWHAYRQSKLDNYVHNYEYIFDQVENVHDYDLSIYCAYMPKKISSDVLEKYDLVLICNGGEPIEVASPLIKELLSHDHVYLISNAWLGDQHPLKQKVIWFPHNVQTCRDYWTRHFYPQYFENQKFDKLPRSNSMIAIIGSNRPNRQFFFDELTNALPELKIHPTISVDKTKLKDCQWESQEDTDFKQWLNNKYAAVTNVDNKKNYYSLSVKVGIQDKFGLVFSGYFVLPLYFENACVVFPDTSWVNHELCLTEKAIKCFYSGSLPMPVAGAGVNKYYNQLGFYTAWNLLPPEYQDFDQEENHRLRYKKLIGAVKWLYDNPQVFESDLFKQLTQENKINFLTCSCDSLAVKSFDNILSKHIT